MYKYICKFYSQAKCISKIKIQRYTDPVQHVHVRLDRSKCPIKYLHIKNGNYLLCVNIKTLQGHPHVIILHSPRNLL